MKQARALFTVLSSLFCITQHLTTAQEIFWEPTSAPQIEIVELAASQNGSIFARGIDSSYRTTDLGASWTTLPWGIGDIGFIHETEVVAIRWGLILVKSIDNGDSWSEVLYESGPLFTLATDGGEFVVTWTGWVDPWSTPSMIRSFNGGLWWEGTPDGAPVIARVHLTHGVHIIRNGSVYWSTDFGRTWRVGLTPPGSPNTITIRSDGFLYAGSADGLFVSISGARWEQRSLDSVSVHSIVFDEEGHLFVATSMGVLSSPDSGYTWLPVNSGLSDSVVSCLVSSPDGYLYAGTPSNGVYRSINRTTWVDRNNVILPGDFLLSQNYPNPFNAISNFGFRLPAGQAGISNLSQVSLKIYDLLGREVATIVNEKLGAGTYTRYWDATGMASGMYVYRLTAGDFTESRKLVLIR